MEQQTAIKTNGDVFESLETGDKVLWDSIKTPVTVTAGYKQGMEDIEQYDNLEAPIIMLEGPRGGQKQLIQNQNDTDAVRVEPFSLHSDGEWVNGLKKVE